MQQEPIVSAGMNRTDRRDSLRRFNWNAGMRSIFDTVCGGTTFIFVAFARSLGLAREQMGWMTFLISGACVVQMVGLPLIGRAANKKRFALTLALVEPALVIAAVILALLLPAPFRFTAFAAAVFMAAAFIHLARPVTDDWLATLIPSGIRGRYLGRRVQIVSTVTIASTLIAGYLGERIGMNNRVGLGLILIAGGVCGLAAVLMLRDAVMPALAAAAQPGWHDFAVVLRTPGFMRILAVNILYNLPFFLACPYYQVFNLEVALMPAGMIALMQTGYYTVKILSLPTLGRLVDRWGTRRTFYLTGFLYAAFFATFLLCGPGRYWPLMAAWAMVALADGAWALAFQSALYASIPETAARPAYFAVNNFATISLFGLGGAIAVPVLQSIKEVHLVLGPLTLGNLHLLYGFCALLMIPCLFSSVLIKKQKS